MHYVMSLNGRTGAHQNLGQTGEFFSNRGMTGLAGVILSPTERGRNKLELLLEYVRILFPCHGEPFAAL